MNVAELNKKYAIPGKIEFKSGNGDFPVAKITTTFSTAEISIYGAHVLSFIPKGEKDLLWMSPKSFFEKGKAIRGGVPVCFPWFGPHLTDSSKPMHGFARLQLWEVIETSEVEKGGVKLILGLSDNNETLALWPYSFSAKVIITVSEKLDLMLYCTNTGSENITIGGALHSYFNVSHIHNISISGLQNTIYYAFFEKEANNIQKEEFLLIKKEENRRYINHISECMITDAPWNRKIRVSKKGSKVTVVWNPYIETTKTMSDIPPDGYQNFVCVEAVNAYSDVIELKPGETHCLATKFSLD
jgi:glucose-6-phosphate 1-epimerase